MTTKENIKEKLADKMIKEKLTFLSVEDTLELIKEYPDLESETGLEYVYSNEEIHDWEWNELPVAEVMKHENFDWFEIWNGYDHFDEFTVWVCPVFTYIDLIR